MKLEPAPEVEIKTEHLKLQTRIKVVTKDVGMKKRSVREGSEDGTRGSSEVGERQATAITCSSCASRKQLLSLRCLKATALTGLLPTPSSRSTVLLAQQAGGWSWAELLSRPSSIGKVVSELKKK